MNGSETPDLTDQAAGRSSRHGAKDKQLPLGAALASVLRRPVHVLIAGWNWKAAAISALLRAGLFLATNVRAGRQQAVRAMIVEALFATVAAGVLGALTQHLRWARPTWATALTVWIALPAVLVAAQAEVHHLAGTPHMRTGLIVSFVFAAFASGFNWFAQRRGVLLAGTAEQRTFGGDLRALPALALEFLRCLPSTISGRWNA